MKFLAVFASLIALLPSALAVSEWGQCGGIGYTGSTSCDSGLSCIYINDWYYQCLPSTTSSSSSSTKSSSTTKASSSTKSSSSSPSTTGTTKFKYFGVSESCAEWGSNIPGTLGVDYTWPSPSSIDFFVADGFNTFRIPFLLERLAPNGLTGSFDATYLSGLKTIVNYATGKGAYAAIDAHNYARYNNAIITDTNAFQTFWKNLASQFSSNSRVIFDLMNEPNGISATDAAALAQAGINGVRASGATNTIFISGTSWTGAWTWVSAGNGDAFLSVSDPQKNTILQMHQYLNSDGSGADANCVSTTVGVERLTAATQWLQANGLKAILGEISGGSNDTCIAAIKGALQYMQQSGVWVGALWWAAGPWWGTSIYASIEPPSGQAVARILPEALLPFV